MAYEGSESAQDNFGKFIHQFKPETKTLITKLERILIKSVKICLYYLIKHAYIRGSLNKFQNFFRMGTFFDSTHMKLVPFEVISSGFNALVLPFQQLLEGPMEVLLCERVNDLRQSLFHLLNCLITTASELRE